MAVRPEYCADRPDEAAPLERFDALSDVLQAIRLRGASLVRESAAAGGVRPVARAERTIHIVVAGTLTATFPEHTRAVRIDAGDLVLLTAEGTLRADTAAEWLTGGFVAERESADRLLAVLPPAIVVRAGTADWLTVGMHLITAEIDAPRPGTRVMVSRILDLLFIHALRAWAAAEQRPDPGWLTAAVDDAIGPVVGAIHRAPERDWSVRDLAALATMSRSSFVGRFTELVGMPPGRYVTEQRLALAADLLATTDRPVAQVAHRVGYQSEAAFSRAFGRRFGAAPRDWRRAGPVATEPAP